MRKNQKKSPKKDRKKEASNQRSPYKCIKCGQPKKGHICTSDYPSQMSPKNDVGDASPSNKKRKLKRDSSHESTEEVENNNNNNNNNINNKNISIESNTNENNDNSINNNFESNVPLDPLDINSFQITPSLFDMNNSIYGFDKNSSISSSYLATASLDGETDFDASWFDLALNGISMLKAFLTINPPKEISEWAEENQVKGSIVDIEGSLEGFKNKFLEFKKNLKPEKQTNHKKNKKEKK